MEDESKRTTLYIPASLRRAARVKAIRLDTSLSAVIRELLERWLAGELKIRQEEEQEES
jgi:hypothetical protein